MNSDDTKRIADLISRIRNGDTDAEDTLLQIFYDDLKAIAARLMKKERTSHTWGPTDLVHNLSTRFIRNFPNITDQQHLFRVATKAMHDLLVDHARKKKAEKRGGQQERILLDVGLTEFERMIRRELRQHVEVEALRDALVQLQKTHPRVYQGIHLRFFCNHTKAETARILGVSEGTVDNDWVVGRTRLRLLLRETD